MKKNIKVIAGLVGLGVPVCLAGIWQQKCIERWMEESKKQRAMFLVMNKWINIKQEDRNLGEYFLKNGYKKIAVYGMGPLGMRLVKELKDSSTEVLYGIDRNNGNIFTGIRMINMNEEMDEVDAVVVTVIKGFDAIREALLEKLNCPVIAFEDILNEF